MMTETAANIAKVRARIQQALAYCHRPPQSVRLLAVSKSRDSQAIRDAHLSGIGEFGENYLQEALPKLVALSDLPLTWHFIGALQANKTEAIAHGFDWVQSLDRLKVAQRLSNQRPAHLGPLMCCIQVNIDAEGSKAGIAPAELPGFADSLSTLPGLRLRGLMVIPNPGQGRIGLESAFSRSAKLFQQLQLQLPSQQIDTLSMGMSADLELAIAAGSSLVRVGTDIFGPRGKTS